MPINMKKQKISKATNVAYRKHPQSVAFATKPSSGIHRVAETTDLQKYKSVRFSGHLFKSELVGLIDKTLQETEALGTEEETEEEEALNCSQEVKKKVHANKKDDGDHGKEESVKVDTSEKLKAKTESEMEDVLFEIKKDLSTFVEIDLRDKVEEKTEDLLTEDQQLGKEEEPPEIVWICSMFTQKYVPLIVMGLTPKFQNSWLCCFGFWMKQEKQKAKKE